MSGIIRRKSSDVFTRREPAGTTLSERIRAAVGQATPTGSGLAGSDHALVLDVSGSMTGWPLAELTKVAAEFRSVRRFEFSSNVREMASGDNPGDGVDCAGTNLALALTIAKSKGVRHAIVITDGQPDDEAAALAAAKGMKIDVFYIGPDPAPEFCRDLAQATGGEYGRASLQAVKALTASVRALLPPADKAIQL